MLRLLVEGEGWTGSAGTDGTEGGATLDARLLVAMATFGFPGALAFGDFNGGGDDATAVGVGVLATGVATE